MSPSGPWAWSRPTAPARDAAVLLRLAGTGHPQIRARHDKTMEFTPAVAVTGRATCVLAVGTAVTGEAPGGFAGPVGVTGRDGIADPVGVTGRDGIAGPVGIEVAVEGRSVEVAAVANPGWRPGDTAVVRRSSNRLPGTLATDADTAAADLPRDLTARLADPAVRVEVVVRRRARHADGRAGLVLMGVDAVGGNGDRLAAELAAADLVIAEDAIARERAEAAGVATGTRAHRWRADDAVRLVGEGDVDRILVLAALDLPGVAVAPLLGRPDLVRVEAAGLPPPLAVAAASPRRGPVHLAGRLRPADARSALRRVPADAQVVFTAAAEHLPQLLGLIAATREVASGVLIARPGTDPWVSWGPVAPAESGGPEVVCCLDGVHVDPDLDGSVETLTRRLAAEGVPTKTLATALAAALGWPRGRAYDTVTRLRAAAPPLPPADS